MLTDVGDVGPLRDSQRFVAVHEPRQVLHPPDKPRHGPAENEQVYNTVL